MVAGEYSLVDHHLRSSYMKTSRLLVIVLVMSLLEVSPVYADEQTTSALIALYNDSVYIPSQEEMAELQRQLNEYNALIKKNGMIHEYNAAVDDAEAYRRTLMTEANIQLGELLGDASKCSIKISEDIYGDINELIACDSEYKVKVRQASTLMDQVNKYSVSTKLITMDDVVEAQKEEIDKKQEELTMPEIQIVDGEFLLGEVYHCKTPADIDYKMTSNWGARISPLTGTSIEYHNGIDIEAPIGTEVYSLFNGRVLEAGENWALGTYIRIQHGPGVVSLYGHLSELDCKAGDYVHQYQLIGKSGNSGNRTSGPHLHIGLFINGQSVDPNVLLQNSERISDEETS